MKYLTPLFQELSDSLNLMWLVSQLRFMQAAVLVQLHIAA
jgi:hypothetical protein